MENTLIACNGIEIYQSDIDILCDEYMSMLSSDEAIHKSYGFTGLLEFLYKRCICNIVTKNGRGYDYHVLDNVFYNVYIPLCAKYSMPPSIIQFCTLVKIDSNYLSSVRRGTYDNGSKVSQGNKETVQKWLDTCEAGLLSRAVGDNSIGAIFALKANYGYKEASTVTVEQVTQVHDTAEQIAARHSGATLPERPEL